MAHLGHWLFPWLLVGCNSVLGIESHDYREQPATDPGAGAAGAATETGLAGASTDAAAAGAPTDADDSDAAFIASWHFENLLDNHTPSARDPGLSFVVQQAVLSSGPTGKYLAFDGSGSAVAPGPVIDTSGSFSISVWVRFDRKDVWSTFVSQDGQTISSFYLQKRNSNYLGFTTYPSDSTAAEPCVATAGLHPRQGEWYHVVATRNSTTGEQRIYVDGILSGRANCPGGFRSDGPLVVGRGKWKTPTDWLDGGIDELGVSARALSAEEVVDLYRLGRPDAHHYLYSYFVEVENGRGDGLHFAHSHDALAWDPVGAGKLYLTPDVGSKSFRDPHLMRDLRGTFHLVWTSSCVTSGKPGCVQDRGFGHATSNDLATFSKQQLIEVGAKKSKLESFRAPEIFYDSETQQYLVSWASPASGMPEPGLHSIYYVLTKDFVSFSEPALLYGRAGHDLVDATIVKQASSYYMFLKNEAAAEKTLRVVSSPSLFGEGAWPGELSAALTRAQPAQGPAPLIQDGKLLLLFDKCGGGGLGAVRSRDLAFGDAADWDDISSSVFATTIGHGSIIELTHAEFHALALRAAE